MSRKGNSMDNGLMENFFVLLKTEMFYQQEDNYKTIDDLIKAKLKGLSPVNYRLQSSNQKLFINCPTFGVQFNLTIFLFFNTNIITTHSFPEYIRAERRIKVRNKSNW